MKHWVFFTEEDQRNNTLVFLLRIYFFKKIQIILFEEAPNIKKPSGKAGLHKKYKFKFWNAVQGTFFHAFTI